jgi:hypothetical protein
VRGHVRTLELGRHVSQWESGNMLPHSTRRRGYRRYGRLVDQRIPVCARHSETQSIQIERKANPNETKFLQSEIKSDRIETKVN